MSRDQRWFEPETLVETSTVTIQNRPLLRPSDELNDLFVGVLGRAQRKYEMTVCAAVALSTHYHLLLVPEDPKHLAVKGEPTEITGDINDSKNWWERVRPIPGYFGADF